MNFKTQKNDSGDLLAIWSGTNIKIFPIEVYSNNTEEIISLETLNEVFKCETKIHKKLAMMIIDCKYQFPAIRRIERKNKDSGSRSIDIQNLKTDGILERSNVISGPFADMNLSLGGSSNNPDLYSNLNINTVWGDQNNSLLTALKVDSEESIDYRLTYFNTSEDLDNKWFTEFKGIDIFSEGVPLIRNTITGKGVSITNFPKFRSLFYTKQTISGPMQQGWEVELYRENQFLGSKTDDTGYFLFEDIPLFYGENEFILKFYGPYGEEREEVINYNIDDDYIKGRLLYKASFMSEVEDNGVLEFKRSESLDLQYPIRDFLILKTFVESQKPNDVTYKGVGLSLLTKKANYQLLHVSDDEKNDVVSAQATIPLNKSSLQFTYQYLNHFESSWYNSIAKNSINELYQVQLVNFFEFKIPLVTQLELDKLNFYEEESDDLFKGRVSSQINNHIVDYTHEQSLNIRSESKQQFNHIKRFDKLRLRNKLSFINYTASSLELMPSYQLEINEKVGVSIQHSFFTSTNSLGVQWGKNFKKYALNAAIQTDAVSEHQITLNLNFGFQRDPGANELHYSSQGTVDKGAISVRAFYDRNYNNKKDFDENFVRNVRFYVETSKFEAITNQDGAAFIGDLPLYRPMKLKLDESSIEEPSLYAYKKEVNFVCHRGKVLEVLFPVVQLGEADSFFQYEGSKSLTEVTHHLRVKLFYKGKLIDTIEADENGYLYLTKLKMGDYTIRPEIIKKNLDLNFEPKEIQFTVSPEDNFLNGLDFLISDV